MGALGSWLEPQLEPVPFAERAGWLPLVRAGQAAPIIVEAGEYPGVRRAARDFAADIERVSGVRPALLEAPPAAASAVVLVGTLGRSPLADAVCARLGLDLETIPGSWERWFRGVVEAPWPGIERALLILGSDKRGSIYGLYELSEACGVSPWYWWADVPVARREALYVAPMPRCAPAPVVKYRGIFLNDEAPALSGWAREKFGGLNSQCYAHVFELLLRLRANTLWPAMWGNAFNEDDPENARLADEYGIVMGTSHHEPMLRAQKEWQRHGRGPWDYASNGDVLRRFWAEGIARNRAFESIVTLGMRGDGDLPMSEGENVALLERIVNDQRAILREHAAAPVERVPQVWALYKEVQAYYDAGMRVPHDVTLLFCDDNWGNLRRLPSPEERERPGGAGIYYHFDYVGGPRSYKWLNTVPIGKIWEQMSLAAAYGAVTLWIVNVGDLKPMEFGIEFFLRLAWAPERVTLERVRGFAEAWAAREFGAEHAREIGELVLGYTHINGRRKPELLEPDTYSLTNYREAERAVEEYRALEARAENVYQTLPAPALAAFFELVLYPIKACANLYDLYFTVGKNRQYARQGRASTNLLFERARALFRTDGELARAYNELLGGKWRHMMDQTRIGYHYWQQPVHNALPAVTELALPARALLGVAIEGSERAWPTDDPNQGPAVLPPLDVYQRGSRYIDVYNRGLEPFLMQARASAPWVTLSPAQGEVKLELRSEVSVDFERAPLGRHQVEISIEGPAGARVVVLLPVENPSAPRPEEVRGFVEGGGYVSIEAAHYARAVSEPGLCWRNIPEHGRGSSAVTTLPVSWPRSELSPASPRLEYDVYLSASGPRDVELYLSPTLDCLPSRSLRCALSFDGEAPQEVNLLGDATPGAWGRAVSDGVRRVTWRHPSLSAGAHVLKVWRVDPALVLQKIVIHTGKLRPSYLGPPESFRGVHSAEV